MLMKSSTQSLTEQLSERFAERIRNRLLAPGARLPSVRQCAQQNGVSPSTVVAAYDQLLALGLVEARKNRGFFVRDSGGAVTLGRVLTLIVKTEPGDDTEAAIAAANEASREHPCRVIVAAAADRRKAARLDAEIRVGGDAGASEVVVLHLFGELGAHADAVVTPFLLPDTPVVTWWPGTAPKNPSRDRLGALGGRRILDGTNRFDAQGVLAQRLRSYAPGDTDIAWAQITPWRALLRLADPGQQCLFCRPR